MCSPSSKSGGRASGGRTLSEEFVAKVANLVATTDLQLYNNDQNIRARIARGSEEEKFLRDNKDKVIEALKNIRAKEKSRKEAEQKRRQEIESLRKSLSSELRTLEKQTNKRTAESALVEIYEGVDKETAFRRARIRYANYYDSKL